MNIKTAVAFAGLALLAACSEPKPAPAPAAPATPGIVPGSEEDLVANVGDRVFFAFDKSNLTAESKSTLDRQAAWLGKFASNNVQLAGNTDDRGTEEYNIALGERRANAARDYLVAKGVAAGRITTISFGKDRPTCMESTEECWAKNRNAITSLR